MTEVPTDVLHDQDFIMRSSEWEDDKGVVFTAESGNMFTGTNIRNTRQVTDICAGGKFPSLESSRDELQRHWSL
jgi:hypothetical protein